MEECPECFVAGPLVTVLYLSKLMGIAPLRFMKKGKGWRISLLRNYNFFRYSILIISIIVMFGSAINEYFLVRQERVQTIMRHLTWVLNIYVTSATVMMMAYNAPNEMRCIISSLSQVKKINSKLDTYNWPTQWRRWHAVYICWMAICATISFADFAMILFVSVAKLHLPIWVLVMHFYYFLCNWLIHLGLIKFILLVTHVRSSFKSINDCLKNILQDNTYDSNPRCVSVIRGISSAYLSACDLMRDVDSTCGPMLMLLLTGIFLHLVTTPSYFIIHSLVEVDDLTSKDLENHVLIKSFDIIQFFCYIYSMVCLIMIIEPCHRTHAEMECTRELVYRLIVHAHHVSEQLEFELKQFSRHLELNRVFYKPMKVTTMTRTLVLSILGSITTYTVVVVSVDVM